MLAAFLIGAGGVVLGTAVAFALVGGQLGPQGYKVAACLCASYIGGSVNFAAVATTLGLAAGPELAAAMTADNLAMAVCIAVLMIIPADTHPETQEAMRPALHGADRDGAARSKLVGAGGESGGDRGPVSAESLGLSLAAAALACTLGSVAAAALGFGSGGLAAMAIIATAAAAVGRAVVGWGRRGSGSGADGQRSTPFRGAHIINKY